jgi:hypothetical protein
MSLATASQTTWGVVFTAYIPNSDGTRNKLDIDGIYNRGGESHMLMFKPRDIDLATGSGRISTSITGLQFTQTYGDPITPCSFTVGVGEWISCIGASSQTGHGAVVLHPDGGFSLDLKSQDIGDGTSHLSLDELLLTWNTLKKQTQTATTLA